MIMAHVETAACITNMVVVKDKPSVKKILHQVISFGNEFLGVILTATDLR